MCTAARNGSISDSGVKQSLYKASLSFVTLIKDRVNSVELGIDNVILLKMIDRLHYADDVLEADEDVIHQ